MPSVIESPSATYLVMPRLHLSRVYREDAPHGRAPVVLFGAGCAITAAMTSKRKFRDFLAVLARRDTLLPRGHPDPMAGTLRVGDNHHMDPTWIVRLDAPGDGPRLAVKDCIDVEGLPTTAGCQLIAEQASPAARDAAVVAAARRAGARIVGKTNLTELCWSASGVNSWSGTPVNPADPGRMPGGSSSGSAVAVAAGEADVALGTDTGGSVRIPAACCGITGLKTTWGRVPVDGVYPLAPSLDTVGLLGADVGAVELGMRLIEPGFAAGSCELVVGRMRPEVDAGGDRRGGGRRAGRG